MIGVFDSGFGGLSVFQELEKDFAGYDLVYLGDSQRNPYGNRSDETVIQWTIQAVEYLFSIGCELVLIACHTASNVALRTIQQDWLVKSRFCDRRVLGVTIPIVEEICSSSGTRVGLLGTKATCRSLYIREEIYKRNPRIELFAQPAPLLVSFVEEGLHDNPVCKRMIREYLRPLKQKQIDTLILGCTHFPLMLDTFRKKAGKRISVPNPPAVIVKKLKEWMLRHEERTKKLSRQGRRIFLTTDDPVEFVRIGRIFLKHGFEAKKISLVTQQSVLRV